MQNATDPMNCLRHELCQKAHELGKPMICAGLHEKTGNSNHENIRFQFMHGCFRAIHDALASNHFGRVVILQHALSACQKRSVRAWPPLTRGLSAKLTGGENKPKIFKKRPNNAKIQTFSLPQSPMATAPSSEGALGAAAPEGFLTVYGPVAMQQVRLFIDIVPVP